MRTSSEPASTVAVLGAGRLGSVLARALRAAGLTVYGPVRRGEEIPASDVVLLCVPDAAIAEAAAGVSTGLVGHVSGATGLDDVDFSLHPLQTFTGAEGPDAFRGIGAAVAGRTPAALAVATSLAEALGTRPFAVDDRAGYHAAASFSSNFVLTVLDAAEQVARDAGLEDARELLAPLVRRTVDNWVSQGAASVLTGPIARGDEQTVARQRAAIDAARPELVALFDELAAATRVLAATLHREQANLAPHPERAEREEGAETERPSSRSARSGSGGGGPADPERGAQRQDEGRSGSGGGGPADPERGAQRRDEGRSGSEAHPEAQQKATA
ncbi:MULTISPECIES: DUF2520 domain-containing protein [unclassified Microbacterium]|uniref:DUF2520 domain-containing protein n=1 Tax=unclassified Microbacterium TaxID=2609290 RepID=UPI0012FA1C30|nr:DUF2520 domain-containing protein [Microbacterium sp. MAH-37]MVQ41455.1 DUF2520 domain-containing protein [Microbacterium sp. MAH-37]